MKHVPYRKKRDTRPDRRQLVRRERGKRRAAQHETRPLQKEKRHPPRQETIGPKGEREETRSPT